MKSCHCVGNMHFVPMVQAQLRIVQEQADTMIAARCQPPFIIILSVSLRQPSNISPSKKTTIWCERLSFAVRCSWSSLN